MKLELKHLAAYLPYEIQILSKIESQIEQLKFEKCRLKSVNMLSKCITVIHDVGINKNEKYITDKNLSDIKLILKPMSLLEKDIEILNILAKKLSEAKTSIFNFENSKMWILEVIKDENATALPFFLTKILLKNHFDVFELIDKELAVDINCL